MKTLRESVLQTEELDETKHAVVTKSQINFAIDERSRDRPIKNNLLFLVCELAQQPVATITSLISVFVNHR
jgi:23S rRNA C2498 (ribose-2'-O)-methylase RlmM